MCLVERKTPPPYYLYEQYLRELRAIDIIIICIRIPTHAWQQQSSCTPTLQKHLCRQISKNISIFTAPDNTTPNRTTFKTNQCKGDLLFQMLLKRTHISSQIDLEHTWIKWPLLCKKFRRNSLSESRISYINIWELQMEKEVMSNCW